MSGPPRINDTVHNQLDMEWSNSLGEKKKALENHVEFRHHSGRYFAGHFGAGVPFGKLTRRPPWERRDLYVRPA